MNNILSRLQDQLEARKSATSASSYTASLYAQGMDAILKKVGEECTELIIAAKNADPQQLIHETADLWFHTLVMLAQTGLRVEDVLQELAKREGVSGLDEKRQRPTKIGKLLE